MSIIDIKQIRGLSQKLNEVSGSLKLTLTQPNHNFATGVVISFYNNNWVIADANDENKLGRVVVESIIDTNTFVGVLSGIIEIDGWGLSPSSFYFVDSATRIQESITYSVHNNLTTDIDGLSFSNPILQAITENIAHVLPWRPSLASINNNFDNVVGLTQEHTQEEISTQTFGNISSTGITLNFKPINNSTIQIYLNGSALRESYGSKEGHVFFSNDGGITAKSLSDIQAGDVLYWNSQITGFQLDSNDYISLVYHKNILE